MRYSVKSICYVSAFRCFEKALEHVTSDPQSTDAQLLAEVTRDSQHEYEFIRQQIATLYEAAGLTYIASDNPFI